MGRNVEMLVYKFMTSKKQRITELPIERDTLYEICSMRGWEINTYQEGANLIQECKLEYMVDQANGFACRSDFGEIYIFYNSNLSYEDQVRTIAHEIGHVALKHTCYKVFGQSKDPVLTARQETEADEFMLYLLSQPLILKKCGITAASEIEKLTYLSRMDANIISEKINGNSDTITVDEEKKIIEQFSSFIRKYKVQKRFNGITKHLHKPRTYITTGLIAICMCGSLLAGYMIPHGDIVPTSITESPQPAEQTENPTEGAAENPQVPQATTPSNSGSSRSSSGGNSSGSYSGGSGSSDGTNQVQQQPAATPYQPPATPQPTQAPTEQPAAKAVVPQGQTVWVAPSGSVYHTRRNCQSIVNNANVKEYDISEVANLSKCKHCIRNGG